MLQKLEYFSIFLILTANPKLEDASKKERRIRQEYRKFNFFYILKISNFKDYYYIGLSEMRNLRIGFCYFSTREIVLNCLVFVAQEITFVIFINPDNTVKRYHFAKKGKKKERKERKKETSQWKQE